ncbi:MAG: hypothetical protein WCF84_24760 [Anaerolineae bacterium]
MSLIAKLVPCKTPSPNRPFVDRQVELKLVADKLNIGTRDDVMPSVVTCFWGGFGSGKTWLLKEFERLYHRTVDDPQSSYPTIAARLDLSPEANPALWLKPLDASGVRLNVGLLVQELGKQLANQRGTAPPNWESLGAEERAREFASQVMRLLATTLPILILDTMDSVVSEDEPAFFWLEEHLIEPLAITDRVLFVFASRGELRRWKRFQVRRRVDSHRLTDFTIKTAGEAVLASTEVSQVLYRHAFGHPLATEYLARQLQEEEHIDLQHADLAEVRDAVTPFVKPTMDAVSMQVLARVPQNLVSLAQVASVLRWVNVGPLRKLVEDLKLEQSQDDSDGHYMDLIGKLQALHLLYWNSETASYRSPPAMRRLVAYGLRLDDPDRFQRAHVSAYQYHCDHLEKYSQFLLNHVSELIFHYASLAAVGSFPENVPCLEDWWNDFLRNNPLASAKEWDEVLEALEEDAELRQTLHEAGKEFIYDTVISDARKHGTSSAVFERMEEAKMSMLQESERHAEVGGPQKEASSAVSALPLPSPVTNPCNEQPEWIKRKLMPEILRAVEADDNSTYVYYIVGAGGSGKTVLLRQIGMALGSPFGIEPTMDWSGLLDLYHSEVNTNSGLEARLVKSFETENEFQSYERERESFKALREAGVPGAELESERAQLAREFARCMDAVTAKRRIVIAIDTTEKMQYALDDVQKMCGLENESTTVKSWLLDQIKQWKNCVVILAGRAEKEPYLKSGLERMLYENPDVRYEYRELQGFDWDETIDYFERQQARSPEVSVLTQAQRERLWKVTKGRPIRLDLAIEVVKNQFEFDKFWQAIADKPLAEAQVEIDKWLITCLLDDEPDHSIQVVLRYLVAASKGLDTTLLHFLEPAWDLNKCREKLNDFCNRSYVKSHPEDERIFLHDEMYALCEEYWLQAPEIRQLSSRIQAYYESRITDLGESGATTDKTQDYQVDSLLYRLRAHPRRGYEWYAKRADYAIRALEVGLDMRLRGELLGFLKGESPADTKIRAAIEDMRTEILYDFAAQWVVRYIRRGDLKKAMQIAERVLRNPVDALSSRDIRFRLARAWLLVCYSEALLYANKTREAIGNLSPIIAEFESDEANLSAGAARPDEVAYISWRRNLVLGRTHNDLGYVYWRNSPQYRRALQEFPLALPYFRASNLLEETANTVDNMGRVYALLYNQGRADSLVEDALQLRKRLKKAYRTALSMLSVAQVALIFGQAKSALHSGERALSFCEGLAAQRGIGSACILLGKALRQLGKQSAAYEPQERENFFREGIKNLDRAIQIFERTEEKVYLIEAWNERGCTYRDWAVFERERSGENNVAGARGDARPVESPLVGSFFRRAVDHLERSVRLAGENEMWVPYVDSCEDLAEMWAERGDFDKAEEWLIQGEKKIDSRYKIREGVGLEDIPVSESVEEFWHMLGKIELERGNLVFDRFTAQADPTADVQRQTLEEAVTHYAFAGEYFHKYSERNLRFEATLKQIYMRVKRAHLQDLEFIQNELLPRVARQYNINPSTMAEFFEDTLGLASQLV